MEQAEVAAGDPHDGDDGLGVGEVLIVQPEPELLPAPGVSTNASSSSCKGRYWWANPTRL